MATVENENFWREFIAMYRDSPEIWQTTNEKFKKKRLKEKAYSNLLTKLREIQPKATDATLKRKLNLLKDGYRRELVTLRQSQKIAKTPDEVYVPKLWFFEELSFLGEKEDYNSETSMDDIEEEMDIKLKDINKNEKVNNDIITEESCNFCKRTMDEDERDDIERLCEKHVCIDEAQVFSVTWATLYRKLDPMQQLYANKAIMDVLYQGQLCLLDHNSIQNIQNSAYSLRSSTHSLQRKNTSWKNSSY